MDKSSLESVAVLVAKHLAMKRFRNDPDREAKIQDAMSVAWELAQAAPENATERTVAHYAVQRVMIGRQFQVSVRSIEARHEPRVAKPQQEPIDLWSVYGRPGDDPAELACFRLTFPEWLKSLKPKKRQIALTLMLGDRTKDVARQFSVTRGYISQLRQELREGWEAFTA